MIRELAAVVRFAVTGEVPPEPLVRERQPRGYRPPPLAPLPLMHNPILAAEPPGHCLICSRRGRNWRHGSTGRALERLRKAGQKLAAEAVR